MEQDTHTATAPLQADFMIPHAALLEHWQGHRRLTRRVIEAFPEDQLFTYSVGGMRPFSALAMEMIGMAAPGVRGIVTGEWRKMEDLPHHRRSAPTTKEELLRLWDETTEEIDRLWPEIPARRLLDIELVFGMYESPIYAALLYWIDNEIHHRGQGTVYLRSLGIAPPPFWER